MNSAKTSRRQFLVSSGVLLAYGLYAIPARSLAGIQNGDLSWEDFALKMQALADAADLLSSEQIAAQGLMHLQSLDISSPSFLDAVATAYESGNPFWLWQRMLKQHNLNGGILNIDASKTVQLHDHPGATGMLRIISGEAEVWQYNRASVNSNSSLSQLDLVSHRILSAGDTAILTAHAGNIHALRSVSAECRMLDFFIPPYQRNKRTWYEPQEPDWQQRRTITCTAVSEHDYVMT